VVGVDFGAASVRAARTALALIDPAPGEPGVLTLVHVRSPIEARLTMAGAWAAEYEASVAAMFSRLRDLLRPYVRDGVTVETRAGEGDIVDRLLEAAEDTGADLVAVGTQGPGWSERPIVGGVVTTTLRRATCSVLVAPAPDAAERVRLELWLAGQVALARPEDWGGALDAFTRRNLLRRARLEVSEAGAEGFVVGASRNRFTGATYDPHDRRVEIMLGDESDGTRHLSHAVANVRSVEIVAQDARRDRTLLIEDARGHTVLTLLD
jgi:nucleotide-binding universal stress UspA family protein